MEEQAPPQGQRQPVPNGRLLTAPEFAKLAADIQRGVAEEEAARAALRALLNDDRVAEAFTRVLGANLGPDDPVYLVHELVMLLHREIRTYFAALDDVQERHSRVVAALTGVLAHYATSGQASLEQITALPEYVRRVSGAQDQSMAVMEEFASQAPMMVRMISNAAALLDTKGFKSWAFQLGLAVVWVTVGVLLTALVIYGLKP